MKVYLYICSWDLLWDSEKRKKFEEIGVQWCLEREGDGVIKYLITKEKIYFPNVIEPTQIQRPLFKYLGEGNTEDFPNTRKDQLITRTSLDWYIDDWLVADRLSKMTVLNKKGLGYISEDFEEALFIYSKIKDTNFYEKEAEDFRVYDFLIDMHEDS